MSLDHIILYTTKGDSHYAYSCYGYNDVLESVKKKIFHGRPVVIDIPISYGQLLTHVSHKFIILLYRVQ